MGGGIGGGVELQGLPLFWLFGSVVNINTGGSFREGGQEGGIRSGDGATILGSGLMTLQLSDSSNRVRQSVRDAPPPSLDVSKHHVGRV